MIKNISRRIFLKIFKRVFLLQLFSLLVIFYTTYSISKSTVEKVVAENVISNVTQIVQNNIFHLNDVEEVCSLLPPTLSFFMAVEGNSKVQCRSEEFVNFDEKDILKGFNKLTLNSYLFVKNRKLKKSSLYYYFSAKYAQKNYSIYYVDSINHKDAGIDEMLSTITITHLILLLITGLLALISSFKLAQPVNSIIYKIFNLSNDYEERNIIEKIERTNQTEWEIIESSFDRTQSANEKLANSLTLEVNKFQALLNAISDPILSIDFDGKILFANNSFLEMLATSYKDDYTGTFYLDIARHYELKNYLDKILNDHKCDEAKNVTELKFEIKGNIRHFLVKTNRLKDMKKKHYSHVCIFNDITQMKYAEKMRVDFVGNVSHEIRTPLTSIKGYIQTLEAMLTESEKQGKELIFNTIQSNCDRLTNLFNDLLSLSTIESQAEVIKEIIDIKELTEQTVSNIQNLYPELKIDVKMTYSMDEIYSDSILIENILQNLVSNCFKYIGREGCLDIDWSYEAGKILLRVKDDGQGIPKEHLPRLFERFYRVDQSRLRTPGDSEYGGSGLGLSIVKTSVAKLGGKASVKSQLNEGTEFIIEIPN